VSRPAPTTYQPISPQDLGVANPIGNTPEGDLLANIHHCWLFVTPTLVTTIYTSDMEPTAGTQPWAAGANPASSKINGIWNFDTPPEPFEDVQVVVLFENTGAASPADDGTIRFDWASDPWVSGGSAGTSVDINARGGSSQWTAASGILSLTATTDDTLRMWVLNGASGEVRVHAVDVRPVPPTTVADGPTTVGSDTFYPGDTTEIDQDSPLSVAWRQTQWNNLEAVRKSRPGHIIGWCENPEFRAGSESYASTSNTYERVITLPFRVPPGATNLRWSLVGYRAGSAGDVRLTTATDAANEEAAIEVALGSTWASPYATALYRYDDGGDDSLGVTENAWDELRIDLQGDGTSKGFLLSLCCWFAPVT